MMKFARRNATTKPVWTFACSTVMTKSLKFNDSWSVQVSCDVIRAERVFEIYVVDSVTHLNFVAAMEGANGNGNNNNNNNGNNNGNYNNGYVYNGIDMSASYWTGLYCASNGMDINLAVFTDAGCTEKAKSGTYEAFNYGAALPYESQSLIKSKACMSCMQVDNDNNNNGNNNNGNNNSKLHLR